MSHTGRTDIGSRYYAVLCFDSIGATKVAIHYLALLEFWFGLELNDPSALEKSSRRWFIKDPDFDSEIRSLFGDLPDAIKNGEYESWSDTDLGNLAAVIALDQFPRNIYRNQSRAYAYDDVALSRALRAIQSGAAARLHPLESVFLFMPLEHAENLQMQKDCVAGLQKLGDTSSQFEEKIAGFTKYAVAHQEVIERFGRFPHRNAILGRESSAEEIAYLASGRGSF